MTLPIPPREPDTVPVLSATPFYAFTQSWQLRPPKDALILIVKGTFDLVAGGPATVSEEQELPLGPVLFEGSEEALRYPGDIAFFKPRCDVLVAGHAYAAPGAPAVRRLHIELGRALSFSMAAIGDRRWERGAPSAPARFEKLELRPERAFGGHDDPSNPIGVGRHAQDGSPLPNFELADQLIRAKGDRPPPAMTTPLAQTWPARARFAGTYGGDWVKKRAPYFPDDFSWDYFQAAQPALQIPYPRGDEWYRLRGFRPNDEALEGRLPCLKLRAFAQPLARPDELTELPLNLDTVFFEPDLLRVQLVWRGAIGAVDQYASDLASLLVVAEPFDQPCPMEEVERQLRASYAAEHERVPEQEEPDAAEPDAPPEGHVPPRGLTAAQARLLGLPPWAATVDSPPLEVAPPPPPQPAIGAIELEKLLASPASLAGLDLSYCDLRARDLRGRDLAGSLLVGASLDGAKLAGASLAGAVLLEASLAGADLTGAALGGAELSRANLEGATFDRASLVEASLAGARAPDASFVGATLDGASAAGAELSRARFDGASLIAADLTEARLEAASFVGAKMEDVRLYGVVAPRMIADDAEMTRSRLDGAMLAGSSLLRVKAPDSSIRSCDLSDASLQDAVLEGSVLEDTVLDRANVNQVEAKRCRWQRARAREATFVKSNLMGGYFEGARFVECDMRGANLYEAETFRSRFERCRLEHAILGQSGLG